MIASSVVVAPFLTYTWPKGIGPVSWEATPVAAAADVAAAASAVAPLASAALHGIVWVSFFRHSLRGRPG